jgi:hypothetical protein
MRRLTGLPVSSRSPARGPEAGIGVESPISSTENIFDSRLSGDSALAGATNFFVENNDKSILFRFRIVVEGNKNEHLIRCAKSDRQR